MCTFAICILSHGDRPIVYCQLTDWLDHMLNCRQMQRVLSQLEPCQKLGLKWNDFKGPCGESFSPAHPSTQQKWTTKENFKGSVLATKTGISNKGTVFLCGKFAQKLSPAWVE